MFGLFFTFVIWKSKLFYFFIEGFHKGEFFVSDITFATTMQNLMSICPTILISRNYSLPVDKNKFVLLTCIVFVLRKCSLILFN